MTGFQLGVINVENETMHGLQLGLLNAAGHLDGIQVGLVNLAERGGLLPWSLLFNASL